MNDITFSLATAGDLPGVQSLLTECCLASEGIELLTESCIAAKVDSKVVGCIALEPYGGQPCCGLWRLRRTVGDVRSVGTCVRGWSATRACWASSSFIC